jgi:uncharacterized protein with von Willebrand factor type A (vWA) domain
LSDHLIPLPDPDLEPLPLLDLFLRLQALDMPLGIGEYRLFLRALQLGFGLDGDDELKWLCHALWCKDDQDVDLFDDQFQRWRHDQAEARRIKADLEARQAAERLAREQAQETGEVSAIEMPATKAIPSILPPSTLEISPIETTAPAQPGEAAPQEEPADLAARGLQAGLEPSAIPGPERPALALGFFPRRRFILSGDYFPITSRQLKQSWRYLRSLAREGPATELDVEATIDQVGHTGHLVEPVMRPPRLNRTELLLLVDQGGSMTPFEDLGDTLVQTARKGGRLGRAGVYYFNNYPEGYLFQDKAFSNPFALQKILDRLPRERTVALIFSDAGAARGGLSSERRDQTAVFLRQLQTGVRRVAWINPMPNARWQGTTAGLIARLVPMFECNRRGFDEAIDVLRGRQTVKIAKR